MQCSLLSAPPLFFLNESSVSAEEDENEDEESNTDISESESGEETDISYSEAVEYDDHLERYGAYYIFLNLINNQYICRLHLPYHEIKKFMVFEECLLALFKKCRNCGDSSTRITTKTTGTFLGIIQNCSNCCYTFKWDSQPVIGSTPVGNILLSASILFSGATPTKVLRVLQMYGCATISERTYFGHQSSFLLPSVFTVWNNHQADLLKQLHQEKRRLTIGGDARADSPGHSAKFGSYTVMELEKKVVIDVELVQVSSYIMSQSFILAI